MFLAEKHKTLPLLQLRSNIATFPVNVTNSEKIPLSFLNIRLPAVGKRKRWAATDSTKGGREAQNVGRLSEVPQWERRLGPSETISC